MSYDLFFRVRSPDQKLSCDDFSRYFVDEHHYEIIESAALYSNEDSGVYFSFEYGPQDESDVESEIDVTLAPVLFNLNFYRPHVFGLEAELEVAKFVSHFDLTVSDSHPAGIGDGEYSRDGFLSGWNKGNEFGYRAIAAQDPTERTLTLPSAQIEACWRWNFGRKTRQDQIGNSVFVPLILFFLVDGGVRTGIAWADGIPILLPEVEVVLMPRHQFAPRRWLRTKDDVVMFEWRELQSIVNGFRRVLGEPACYELFYDIAPPEFERAIRQKCPTKALPERIALDQILNRELVEKAGG